MQPASRIDGWRIARYGACLHIDRGDGPLTAAAALALGQSLNGFARDAELYAVVYAPGVLALKMDDVASDAAPAVAELLWRLDCFSKPTVSLMHGPIGEVGLAFALAGTHQAISATARITISAPGRGRLPPGNVLASLARVSDPTQRGQVYCGGAVSAANALAWDWATHLLRADDMQAVRDGLALAEPVDPLLDDRHQPLAPHDQPAERPSEPLPGAVRHALAKVPTSPLEAAFGAAARYDIALQRLGIDATTGAIDACAAAVPLDLPARRTLQAFRRS